MFASGKNLSKLKVWVFAKNPSVEFQKNKIRILDGFNYCHNLNNCMKFINVPVNISTRYTINSILI